MASSWRTDFIPRLTVKIVNLGLKILNFDDYRNFFHPNFTQGMKKASFIRVPDDMTQEQFDALPDTYEEIVSKRIPTEFFDVMAEKRRSSRLSEQIVYRVITVLKADIVRPWCYIITSNNTIYMSDKFDVEIVPSIDKLNLNQLKVYRIDSNGEIDEIHVKGYSDIIITRGEILRLENFNFRIVNHIPFDVYTFNINNYFGALVNLSDIEIYDYSTEFTNQINVFNPRYEFSILNPTYFMSGLSNGEYSVLFRLLKYLSFGMYIGLIRREVIVYSALVGFVACKSDSISSVSISNIIGLFSLNENVFFYHNYDNDLVYLIQPVSNYYIANNPDTQTANKVNEPIERSTPRKSSFLNVDVLKTKVGPLPSNIDSYRAFFQNSINNLGFNQPNTVQLFNNVFDIRKYYAYANVDRDGYSAELYKFKCLLIADRMRPRFYLIGEDNPATIPFIFYSYNAEFDGLALKIQFATSSELSVLRDAVTATVGNSRRIPPSDFNSGLDFYQFENHEYAVSLIDYNYPTAFSIETVHDSNALYYVDEALNEFDLINLLRNVCRTNSKLYTLYLNTMVSRYMENNTVENYFSELIFRDVLTAQQIADLRATDSDLLLLMYYCQNIMFLTTKCPVETIYIVVNNLEGFIIDVNGTFTLSHDDLREQSKQQVYQRHQSKMYYYTREKIYIYNINYNIDQHIAINVNNNSSSDGPPLDDQSDDEL